MKRWTDDDADQLLELMRTPLLVEARDDQEEQRLQAVLDLAWRAAKEVQFLRAELRECARRERAQYDEPAGDFSEQDPALLDYWARLDWVRLGMILGADSDDRDAMLRQVAALKEGQDA